MDNDMQRTGLSGIGDRGAEFAELIERLEKATGQGDELNLAIFLYLHPGWEKRPWKERARREHWFDENGDTQWGATVPNYTASIDAAVALVPEGWAWFVQWIGKPFLEGQARLWIPAQRTQNLATESIQCEAATPAIALCIAALRARAALSKAETT